MKIDSNLVHGKIAVFLMRKVILTYLFFIILTSFSFNLKAELIISLRSPEITTDSREDYNYALISLALEVTKAEYGDYKIINAPPMNTARSIYSLRTNAYPNLLVELSYQRDFEKDLIPIYFPVELGVVGYRVCFVSPNAYDKVEKAKSLEELKKFTVGQGFSWADTDILRHNGFTVVEIGNYSTIFRMVANNRIDLFCRGANEIENEYKTQKGEMNLLYDKKIVIFYPLPRFYYFNKNNLLAKERIEKGLKTAYADGSVHLLWEKHFGKSVNFVNLNTRDIYKLENPFIVNLDKEYEKYFYIPIR